MTTCQRVGHRERVLQLLRGEVEQNINIGVCTVRMTFTDCTLGIFLQLCYGADGNVCSNRAQPRFHSSREGGAHLHPLPRRAGSGGPGSSHGADCVCPEVHSVDAVQRKDANQQSRWSVSNDKLLPSLSWCNSTRIMTC